MLFPLPFPFPFLSFLSSHIFVFYQRFTAWLEHQLEHGDTVSGLASRRQRQQQQQRATRIAVSVLRGETATATAEGSGLTRDAGATPPAHDSSTPGFYPRGRSQGVVVVREAEEGGSRTPPDVGVPADSPQGEEEDEG